MVTRRSFVPVALALLAGSTASMGQVAPETANPPERDQVRGIARFFRDGFPFHDVRFQPDSELPTGSTLVAAQDWLKSPAGVGQAQAFADLQARVPTVKMDLHSAFASPDYVRSTEEFLTAPAVGQDPKVVVRDFLAAYPGLFSMDGAELEKARLSRDYSTKHNGVRHLSWQQQINGVELFEAKLHANVMPDGRLINIGGTMLSRPAGDFTVKPAVLTQEEAIAKAAANVGMRLKGVPARASEKAGLEGRVFWTVAGMRKDSPVVTRPIYFPVSRTDIRTAWAVVIPSPGGPGHTYDMIVDAVDGSVLYRANRLKFATTEPITFRVYTSDSPNPGSPGTATPNGFQFPAASRSLVVVTPAMMQTYSPNGWIDDGGTETQGNNVDAHLDINADNVADTPRPNGGAGRVFDFPMNTALEPGTYGSAAAAQLFYLCNVYHDRMYALGFDEAAGNFQTLNFSGQGVGNDRIQADAQDGSGTNNANWSSSGVDGEPDGSPPRTQMYVFDGATPDRDGSFDADIVFHEFTHGLSIRLHDGRLNTANQEGGMGEGWSDFYGLCLNAQPTDDFNAVYAVGAYATYNFPSGTYTDNYYFGIRRFPYSTDMTKNPLTYADLDPAQNSYPPGTPQSPIIGNTANAVHNVGELWCMTLLEVREQLSRSMGFAANDEIMRLAIDGMKLDTASDLTFLNERDAILQSDLVNNGGANAAAIWAGFSKRGQGFSATTPATGTSGIVEAFDTPIRVVFSFPGGTPSQLQPGEATSFDVDLTPLGLTIVANSGLLHYSIDGGTFQTVPTTQVDSDTLRAEIPARACFERVDYYVSVDTSAGRRSFPSLAPSAFLTAEVYNSIAPFTADSFETNTGWTVGPNTATAGLWTRVDPIGTTAQPENDVSNPGTICWVTGQGTVGGGLGEADVDGGSTILTSPAYDLSGQSDAVVSYYRWYDNSRGAAPNTDVFTVQVSSNNGATWVDAEVIGPGGLEVSGVWIRSEWRLSSVGVTPSSQVRVRFIAADEGTGSLVEAAVDDFAIATVTCVNPPACPADWNNDSGVDGDDVIAFFADWDANVADYNNDGGTDGDDVIAFFADWDAGC